MPSLEIVQVIKESNSHSDQCKNESDNIVKASGTTLPVNTEISCRNQIADIYQPDESDLLGERSRHPDKQQATCVANLNIKKNSRRKQSQLTLGLFFSKCRSSTEFPRDKPGINNSQQASRN